MPPKKRGRNSKQKADGSDSEDTKPIKKQKDIQKSTSQNLDVPVDEGCNADANQSVYIADDGTIYDASLNQTNAGNNNNKFYRVQVVTTPNGQYCWTRWGRVGEHGQSALLGGGDLEDAIKNFDKKFKDKSGHKWVDRLDPPKKGKYVFIERDYEAADDNEDDSGKGKGKGKGKADSVSKVKREIAESLLEPQVQQLMQLIFNQQFFASAMADLNYDADKLPLGKLSQRTIQQGFQALKDLSELFINQSLAQSKHDSTYQEAVSDLSNMYYTVIPHSFGRNRPPTINNQDMLKREIELLDSLSDMSIADGIMNEAEEDVEGVIPHPVDNQFKGLGMKEMTALDHSSNEFKMLQDYLLKSHGSTHYMSFTVEDIFRIERDGEKERYSSSPYGKAKGAKADRRLLWHGSRCTNYGGILSQGLRIAPPEAPVSGYMFGKGVYLADISSKSAGYCAHHMSNNTALLLLCDAQLGKPMLELTNADYEAGEKAKKEGKFATWGKGRTAPVNWMDGAKIHKSLKGVKVPDVSKPPGDSKVNGAGLLYNEYICYDVAQICLRYLFRVKVT